jgi:hypothetical protein
MTEPDYDILEELEDRLVPLLTRRGIQIESIQPIGLIGRGASSSVFSLLINGHYHVLKLYYSHTSYLREQRNRRRLIWPPKLLLSSKQNDNSLGYDVVVTEVPEGTTFNSNHLLAWVQDRLGGHLIELHRIKRARRVSTVGLRTAVSDVADGAMKAAEVHGGQAPALIASLVAQLPEWLNKHSAAMRVTSSLLHNDLWWDNIVIAKDDVYLIDWESMKTGDYAEDLAFARVMMDYQPPYYKERKFWQTSRNEGVADRFWAGIVDRYRQEFEDETIHDRLRFYLVLQTLRRLSDMGYSDLEPNRDLLKIWIDQLPLFWDRGLELDGFIAP